jgi:phage baseplate assembly protein gpV
VFLGGVVTPNGMRLQFEVYGADFHELIAEADRTMAGFAPGREFKYDLAARKVYRVRGWVGTVDAEVLPL